MLRGKTEKMFHVSDFKIFLTPRILVIFQDKKRKMPSSLVKFGSISVLKLGSSQSLCGRSSKLQFITQPCFLFQFSHVHRTK